MIGTVGAMVSFQEGSQLLRELAGIGIDASQVSEALKRLAPRSPPMSGSTGSH
jgi:hypothetical protein